MERGRVLADVEQYYGAKLRDHGATPRGVDWNSAESQALRFDRLLELLDREDAPTLNDYGCGYGALVDHLQARGKRVRYRGFDICAEMVTAARALHPEQPEGTFICDEALLQPADYCLASGIFNVRLEVADDDWLSYVLDVLERINARARTGLGFNALSIYSDPERRRRDLYYADPALLFDHCKRRLSPYVRLLHDYPLHEFTILVKKP